MPTLLVAHLHFLPTHKPMLKNAKELPIQRTTTRQQKNEMDRQKKGLQLTGVWQNGGRSAKLSFCTSINIIANLNICTSNPPLRQAPKR